MHLLPTNLGVIADCAAKEDTKYAISGVRLLLNDNNTYRVEATDTRFLAIVTGPCVAPSDEHPLSNFDPMTTAPNGHKESLVGTKAFKDYFAKAAKLTKKAAGIKPILGSVATVIGEKETTLGCTDLEQRQVDRLTNIEGRYPPVDECIPKKPPIAKFKVDAKRFADFLKIAAAFSDPDKNNSVEIQVLDSELKDGFASKPIVVKTSNGHRQTFYGIQMPLS